MIPRRLFFALPLAAIPAGAGAVSRKSRPASPARESLPHKEKHAADALNSPSRSRIITLAEIDEMAGARRVYTEARGEPSFGQMAIVHVMLNRIVSPASQFAADTSMSIACARHEQFAPVIPIPTDAMADMRSIVRQATLLWNEGRDFSKSAVFFKRCGTRDAWGPTEHAVTIGNHEFRSVS